ncbi:MAG: hypothetical protein ACXVW7_17045, partial [Trebonia sp.]
MSTVNCWYSASSSLRSQASDRRNCAGRSWIFAVSAATTASTISPRPCLRTLGAPGRRTTRPAHHPRPSRGSGRSVATRRERGSPSRTNLHPASRSSRQVRTLGRQERSGDSASQATATVDEDQTRPRGG